MDIDIVVRAYVNCRDSLATERAKFKQVEQEHKVSMDVLEEELMKQATAQGVESFKTQFGTAFVTKKDFIKVENWDAALDYMLANDLRHLLTKSVAKAAAKEYMDENNGALPPGLNYGYIPAIGVRRK